MKKTQYLITLGESWHDKYASVSAESLKSEIERHIWQAIKNAASQNQSIMNFPVMINSDGATINFVITRNDTLGYKKIKVLNFDIAPSSLAAKYQPAALQIEKYLNKNWELFPSRHQEQTVDYDNFAINLTYKPDGSGDMIAGD